MMRVEVTLPNGQVVAMMFADDTPLEEIKSARERLVGQAQPAPVEIRPIERPDYFERRRKPMVISSYGRYPTGARPPRRRGG